MTELENIKIFFTNTVVKDCVSIKKVEQLADIPIKSLYFFLQGAKYRYLTEEQIERLVPVIIQIGYRPVGVENQFL